MIRLELNSKAFFLAVVLSFLMISVIAADRYSVANGNWNSISTWSATSGGASGASVPGASDNVFIEGGYTVSITANASCINLAIANGSALNIGAFDLIASGTTSVNGTIDFTNATGTKRFIGLVTISATGSWNNSAGNAPINFRGGVSNIGILNAGTGIYTFNTNNQALTGTLSIPNVTVTGITLSNNGMLTVGTALSGNGGLTQGVSATLNLGGTSTITTLTASNNGNLVNYSGAAQSVKVSSYFDLSISGSDNKTMSGNISVNGALNLAAGTFSVGANTLSLNGPTIAGTPANLVTIGTSSLVFGGTTAGVLIPTNIVALNGLSITNTNIVTLQSSPTISGTFNPGGGGLSIGANTLTLNGQVNCGTLVGGATSNITINASGLAANLSAVTLNNLTINRALVTMCGNVTVGGNLTLTSGALSIAANTLTLSDGATLTYGGGTLTGGATSNLTIGTGADITLNAVPGGLNNFTTSRNITLGAGLSLNGTLTLTTGTFAVGANTLTLNGPAIAGTPTNLLTVATSNLTFGGSSTGVSIPSSIINLANLTINNANGVTMNSNITLAAAGVLTLSNGLIQSGTYILKINNTNPVAAIAWTPGSFVNITTGAVERTLLPNLVGTGINYLFPIGEGGVFKGINLRDVNTGATGPVLRATVNATGALTGDGTTIGTVNPRYWSLINLNSGNLTSAKVELYENGLDFSKTIGMSSAVPGNYSSIGGSSNAPSIISPVTLNPGPYFCIGASILDTYYSYQTGDWNTTSTWTSDPSGTLQIGSSIPGDNDKVIILSGRTVSLPANITTQNLDITIDAGGFLDQTVYRFTNDIYSLRGQGTVKLASVNFPFSIINTFVNAGGGTTEFENTANFTLPAAQNTYNNLTISTSGFVATQLSNITINGNFHIKSGTFQINNNVSVAKLTLTVNGNITVDTGAFITVGNGATNPVIGGAGGVAPFLNYYLNFHTVIIKGDFTNNGTVRFTNLPYPIYNAFPPIVAGPTSGAASVYFQGPSDNNLNCNGVTDFYNLILDKGIDQTFKLTINSTNYSNFRLFGANSSATDGAVSANPNVRKALWIRTGTLVLKGSLIIPSLSEGIAGTSDYYIPAQGVLVVDDVDVVVLSSADDYREINTAYTVAAPNDATIGITRGGISALYIFGKLQINNGYLSTRESGGLITSNVASGQFIINGGTIDSKQFLSSTGFASYSQSGGLVLLRGRFQRTPLAYTTVADLTNVSAATLNTIRALNSINPGFGTFNLEQSTNIFTMSGGTIRIFDVCGIAAGEQEAFDVKSSSSNINVAGGTLEIVPVTGSVLADAPNYSVFANAPIYNFIINRATSISAVRLSTPLIVLNDLSLSSGDFNANNLSVTVGRNLIIEDGISYITGTNTTILNGSSSQIFTVNLSAPLYLNKLTIDKPPGGQVTLAGSQNTININDNLRLVSGTLNDNGKTINVSRDIYNSGLQTGTGKIVLNGTMIQSIDGDGIFQNVELNNTNAAAAPVSLAAKMTINGILTFSQDKLFYIGTYNLKLNSTASFANSSATRYVQTAGNAGDGGITRDYTSMAAFVFPVGAPTISPVGSVKYTPATIGFSSAPAGYGSITVVPVGFEHPNTTINGQSLTYFWRMKSAGFSGIAPNSIIHSFVYGQSDVVGNEANYTPALYNNSDYSWRIGTSANPPIDVTNNLITDWTTPTNSADFLDGDYTAGDGAFGTPQIYYSRQNGLWGNPASWSLTSHIVTDPPATAPGVNDIVIIGNSHTISFSTPGGYLTNPNTDPQSCASLQIAAGSVLDIRFNPASVFSLVQSHPGGNGTIRIACDFDNGSTFVFPLGDFSDFNNNLGTTDLYSTNNAAGTTFWLPNGITSYGNLIISPLGGSNIIFPNNNLTVLGNLIMRGQNAESWFCPTWNGNYPTAPVVRVSKTITVIGNFDIQAGSFGWYGGGGGGSQDIVVNGNVIVAPGAGIDVWGSNTSQSMSIGGSLINNSTNAPNPGTVSYVNLTLVPVTFFGTGNESLSNTAGTPRTLFGTVRVNKGTNASATFTIDIGGILTTLTDNWLILQNGTLRYMRTDPPAGANFTISTTTPFNIPSTAGLYVDYSNANNTNILIGNAANNNGDLLLSGKLTIVRGNVYVGQLAAPVNNNDIEYSGGGASSIEVQGGNLVVNGQIRRNTSTSNGILNYIQSGGSVTINGNAANTGYAKLEVLNAGSGFNMSAGTLTIVRGGGTTYGDLYLRPASSSVTGGTIIFTNGIPNTLQNYLMDANIPLKNLSVTGTAGVGLNANLGLIVSPLVLNGTLTLGNTQSILNSNNINVTLKGNLENSGTYNFGTNTTTFKGAVQVINGSSVTNFYNLKVSSSNTLNVNNSFSVYRDMEIGSGTLVLGNKKVTLSGNLVNSGSYSDDNTTGGISLSGTTQQQISGTGAYGKLEINNNSGAKLNNDIFLRNDLVLTQGIFNINSNRLTLSENSIIIGVPDITRMVMSDGVISSFGLRKFFTASPQSFTYPVGVAGKYTPATFTITANGSIGYINVNPVNSNHPSVFDPMNVLKYYWQFESSGIGGFDGTVLLQYLPGDVQGLESVYVAARLELPGNLWYKAPAGPATDNVDETNHRITFTYSGSSNLNGDYTAGIDAAIPAEVSTYETNSDGNWSDQSIWTPVGGSPPCPAGGPNGAIVVINHVVNIIFNNIFALNTTINNELRVVSPTFGHNLGNVGGNGTIYLENGNLPAGDYTSFIDCSGNGTIEYGGTGNYTIIASLFSSMPNIVISGTGTRVLPNKDLTICKRLIINGASLDNSVNNRKLTILGTLERYNSGVFISGTGTYPASTVTFAGSALQTLGGPSGDFTGINKFNNFEINNPLGLNIGVNGLVEVNNELLLTNGIISTTNSNKLTLLSTSSTAVFPSGGSDNSFISGPLIKNIINGRNFIYPLGKGTIKGHSFTLTSLAGSTLPWTTEYFTPNSTSTSLTPPLVASNSKEYWSVSASSVSDAKVKIGWDPSSDLTPIMTQNGMADMRVAEYSGSAWNELTSTTSGNNNTGEVETTNNTVISTIPKNFTIASISPTKPRASFTSTQPVCGNSGILISFTSFNPINLNYTLDYTINGVAQATETVTALPYTLPTPVAGTYILTGFKYNNGLISGVVDPTELIVYSSPIVSNAGPDQSLCGVSGTVLAGNNPAPFSGLWTILSGAGGTFINNSQNTTAFTGLLGETYTLQWTISNVSCTSSDEVVISFPVAASIPSGFSSAPNPVCQGSGGHVYTVLNVPGNTYNWSYSGTGHTFTGAGNSITIDFNLSATSGTLSVTATNSCGTSPARDINITVTPLPVATFSYTGSPYLCNASNPLPTFSGGGIAGTFSSTPGLVFVSTATGQVNLSASTPGTYTVTNTIAPAGGCGVVTATSSITISFNLVWTGILSSDWNVAGNWSCGYVPGPTNIVQIPVSAPNMPVLNPGATASVNNLTIEAGSSLTISGNTIQIAGTITNSGVFTATTGTVEFNGSAPQVISAGIFAGNTIKDLTVNNNAGVTLLGPLNVSGIVTVSIGNLSSDGNLTLISTAAGTALISGSGTGSVTGNVTMQRYLPSGFGYKYFSSPFQAATVGEFADDMDLAAPFSTFYMFDENRYFSGVPASGWVNYNLPANILNPLSGYAVNFGALVVANTVDVAGIVNNGPLSVPLYNHDQIYTTGFNLVGNPYPSPIDWNLVKVNNTNVDDAIYFFNATDEYDGTYSSLVNGVPSNGATSIIPSMQGFFVHITPLFPVEATLVMNNSVRITDQTSPFAKSVNKPPVPLLRLAASFSVDTASFDPVVVYFDDKATTDFDTQLDALKMFNTSTEFPNLYAVSSDGSDLSINSMPFNSNNSFTVPLSLSTYKEGDVIFKVRDLSLNLPGTRIYFSDTSTGTEMEITEGKEYKISLPAADFINRFYINFSNITTNSTEINTGSKEPIIIYCSRGILKAEINELQGSEGLLLITNITGQTMYTDKVYEKGHHEFTPSLKDGIYIISYVTGKIKISKKIIFLNR